MLAGRCDPAARPLFQRAGNSRHPQYACTPVAICSASSVRNRCAAAFLTSWAVTLPVWASAGNAAILQKLQQRSQPGAEQLRASAGEDLQVRTSLTVLCTCLNAYTTWPCMETFSRLLPENTFLP